VKWFWWIFLGIVIAHAINTALAYTLNLVNQPKGLGRTYVMISGGIITSAVEVLVELVSTIGNYGWR